MGIARLKVSIDVYFGREEAGGGGGGVWNLVCWRAANSELKSRTVILYPCVLGIPIPDLPTPKPCKSGVFEKKSPKNLEIGTTNLEVYKQVQQNQKGGLFLS